MNDISLFVESDEELGILYNGYSPILDKVEKFLDLIEINIDKFNDDTKDYKVDLRSDINEFKKVVNSKIYPEELEVKEVSKYILLVKKFKNGLDKLLTKYADLKDKMSFGGNLYRNSIKKTKVLGPKLDPEAYENVSISLNNINRALDWAEKCLLDLFNLADQDINLLTLLDKVYVKQHIFEGKELPHGVYDENETLYEDSYKYRNSQDKETGDVPDYIKLNHKMASYIPGEEPEDDTPKNLDDYKRSSDKSEPSQPAQDNNDYPEYKGPTGDDSNLSLNIPKESPEEKKANEEHKQQAINNYYYYTYNNSMNKNSNSFNKDHSIHDDHHRVDKSNHYDYSKHSNSRNDDHSSSYDYSKNSKSSTDNHSNVKNTVNNYTNKSNNDIDSKDDKKEYHALEWTEDWELNDPATIIDLMTEDSDDGRPQSDDDDLPMRDVGDADNNRPQSDNPIRDTAMDAQAKLATVGQKVKRQVQQAKQVVSTVSKPVADTMKYINNTVRRWNDAKETELKQKMADPHTRSTLMNAIMKSIKIGAFYKAGLLWNPLFIALAIYNKTNNKRMAARLRQEMIGELKTEIEVIDEKIKDADANKDNKEKYQLMRFKNELNKKLLRVDGGDRISKIL